jgi:hypothetical protein
MAAVRYGTQQREMYTENSGREREVRGKDKKRTVWCFWAYRGIYSLSKN